MCVRSIRNRCEHQGLATVNLVRYKNRPEATMSAVLRTRMSHRPKCANARVEFDQSDNFRTDESARASSGESVPDLVARSVSESRIAEARDQFSSSHASDGVGCWPRLGRYFPGSCDKIAACGAFC